MVEKFDDDGNRVVNKETRYAMDGASEWISLYGI